MKDGKGKSKALTVEVANSFRLNCAVDWKQDGKGKSGKGGKGGKGAVSLFFPSVFLVMAFRVKRQCSVSAARQGAEGRQTLSRCSLVPLQLNPAPAKSIPASPVQMQS